MKYKIFTLVILVCTTITHINSAPQPSISPALGRLLFQEQALRKAIDSLQAHLESSSAATSNSLKQQLDAYTNQYMLTVNILSQNPEYISLKRAHRRELAIIIPQPELD